VIAIRAQGGEALELLTGALRHHPAVAPLEFGADDSRRDSQRTLPITAARDRSNISSAAGLKAVKRQFESNAKKPSPIPSRRASTDGSGSREARFEIRPAPPRAHLSRRSSVSPAIPPAGARRLVTGPGRRNDTTESEQVEVEEGGPGMLVIQKEILRLHCHSRESGNPEPPPRAAKSGCPLSWARH